MKRVNRRSRINPDNHPPIICWFCDHAQILTSVLKNSILISREDREGGPYYVFICPYCFKDGMLEETPKGRWFSSPNVKLGLLDYLFIYTDRPDSESEVILKAISWFRENEERRQYFFKRDGDTRYRSSNFLKKLWPWGKSESPEPQGESTSNQKKKSTRDTQYQKSDEGSSKHDSRKSSGQNHQKHGPNSDQKDGGYPRQPRILTPQEILGVDPDASAETIKKQFHRLAVQYHPDKVHHLGEEFQEKAHSKFVELQEAYATLLNRSKLDSDSRDSDSRESEPGTV